MRVLGLIGATENLPSGRAVKPGDIVRALDGTTIEINNTDAEGRLVLADCLAYARRRGCERLVDVATLTGGVVVALGSTYAGLMSNDDAWAAARRASAASGPASSSGGCRCTSEYAEMVKGRYAQIDQPDRAARGAAITAAEFLHHFAGDVPWAHLDIAGTAYDVRRPYFADKGATGFGVRLLVDAGARRVRRLSVAELALTDGGPDLQSLTRRITASGRPDSVAVSAPLGDSPDHPGARGRPPWIRTSRAEHRGAGPGRRSG